MKLYLETSHSESGRTFMVEIFVKMLNVLKPLVIFAGELYRGCLTGFQMRLCPITYYSSKKNSETFQHWGYTRESQGNSLDLNETQKQQDEILDSLFVLISLSNTLSRK